MAALGDRAMARVWEPPPEARWGMSSPRRGFDQAAAVVVILCPPRGQAAHATVVPHAHATLQPCPEMLAALFLHVPPTHVHPSPHCIKYLETGLWPA